jgi:type II secretory pathway pseudopilin PulG
MEILIVVAIIVVLAGAGTMYLLPRLGEAKDSIAYTKAKQISQAVEIYQKDNGPPPSLEALTQRQPNGGKALLEIDVILDPWGKVYQYDPAGPMNDGNRPDVWTTSPESGKRIGNWSRTKQ